MRFTKNLKKTLENFTCIGVFGRSFSGPAFQSTQADEHVVSRWLHAIDGIPIISAVCIWNPSVVDLAWPILGPQTFNPGGAPADE